ncbi:hypothetical protein PSET11_00010 [Arthrobacter ulcerisalmonis]|uniref:Uncharacterized protein n=1 Tax=Arthrobacter ulcerisalmonis TaxID=2483813 RepID=A0A3P5WS59_9MICC|nr:hypothetical protein PSET11_00010 [Arthrobacter ulcerisalmonis]
MRTLAVVDELRPRSEGIAVGQGGEECRQRGRPNLNIGVKVEPWPHGCGLVRGIKRSYLGGLGKLKHLHPRVALGDGRCCVCAGIAGHNDLKPASCRVRGQVVQRALQHARLIVRRNDHRSARHQGWIQLRIGARQLGPARFTGNSGQDSLVSRNRRTEQRTQDDRAVEELGVGNRPELAHIPHPVGGHQCVEFHRGAGGPAAVTHPGRGLEPHTGARPADAAHKVGFLGIEEVLLVPVAHLAGGAAVDQQGSTGGPIHLVRTFVAFRAVVHLGEPPWPALDPAAQDRVAYSTGHRGFTPQRGVDSTVVVAQEGNHDAGAGGCHPGPKFRDGAFLEAHVRVQDQE